MSAVESAWPRYPDYRIDLVPCRGRARVRIGEVVLAESESALRLIETDHVERLYFPMSDVRLDRLEPTDHTSVCPFKGEATYWSFADEDVTVDNLFWTYADPFEEVAGIRGYLGVYHEKVEVDVESAWPDGARSVNRFPIWGDLADLLAVLEPAPRGDGTFAAPGYHERTRNVVEGGQLVGQAVLAAARTLPEQQPTWTTTTFVRAARFDDEVRLSVRPVRAGRTFSTLAVESTQDGKAVTTSLVLMDRGAPDVLRHTVAKPEVPGPESAVPYDMRVSGRDLRIVDAAYDPDPEGVGPPVIHAWIRFRDNPSEQNVRKALVAQATTHWTIAAAMRPHVGFGEDQAHTSLSTAPVALSLSFHDDAPLDEWLLYSTTAIWAGHGLVQGDGTVFTERGVLVASFSLQAMVRGMLPAAAEADPSRAM
ncbi:MAG TPA: DUF427 domain-containing protein [Acidimicrobiales bacterium]|nr:DUF427 domain-containing protein [Acidimicrobiales bacterium]